MSEWILLKGVLPLGVLILVLLGVTQPICAQGSKPQDPPAMEQSDDTRQALVQKLAADPRVKQPEALRKTYASKKTARLIVNISPPGAMAGYSSQEQRVEAALNRFIGALSPETQRAVVRRFKTIYAFLVTATPEQLEELLEQQDVTSVEADGRARILPAPVIQ